jgi:hypothetical protein
MSPVWLNALLNVAAGARRLGRARRDEARWARADNLALRVFSVFLSGLRRYYGLRSPIFQPQRNRVPGEYPGASQQYDKREPAYEEAEIRYPFENVDELSQVGRQPDYLLDRRIMTFSVVFDAIA